MSTHPTCACSTTSLCKARLTDSRKHTQPLTPMHKHAHAHMHSRTYACTCVHAHMRTHTHTATPVGPGCSSACEVTQYLGETKAFCLALHGRVGLTQKIGFCSCGSAHTTDQLWLVRFFSFWCIGSVLIGRLSVCSVSPTLSDKSKYELVRAVFNDGSLEIRWVQLS